MMKKILTILLICLNSFFAIAQSNLKIREIRQSNNVTWRNQTGNGIVADVKISTFYEFNPPSNIVNGIAYNFSANIVKIYAYNYEGREFNWNQVPQEIASKVKLSYLYLDSRICNNSLFKSGWKSFHISDFGNGAVALWSSYSPTSEEALINATCGYQGNIFAECKITELNINKESANALENWAKKIVDSEKNAKIIASNIKEANLQIQQNKFDEATQLLKEVLRLDNDNSEAKALLAQLEARKKEQERKKAEAANAELQKATQNKTNPSKAEDDFWGGNQSSNKSNSNTTSAGGASQSSSRPQEQQVKTQQQINQEALVKYQQDQKRIAEQNEATRAAVQQEIDKGVQKIQGQMAVGFENQRLSDQINTSYYKINKMATFEPTNRYKSVEQINADYNSKIQFIYTEIDKNRDLQRQQRNNVNNYYQQNGDNTEKALSGIITSIGSMSDDRSARLEREKYNAELKAERDKKIAEFEKAQWDALIKNRNGLINGYPDGGVPLSSAKINQQQLYYFSYYFNKLSINDKNPEVVVSNVFFVSRYGDGTWPFKNAIVDDLKKISGKNQITLVGFYTSEAEASKMRELFLYNSKSCSFKVMEFSYNRNKVSSSNSAGNSSDFWGDSKKPTPVNTLETEQSKPAKKDDFWD